ncbi:MAG: hypothetical protein WAV18_02385 [Roseiarcus sp.]
MRIGAARVLLRICCGPCAISWMSGTSPSQHSRRRFPTAPFLAAIGGALKHEQIESRAPAANVEWAMLARWRDAPISKDAQLHWEIHADRMPRERMESLIPQFEAPNADLPARNCRHGSLGTKNSTVTAATTP